MTEYTIPQNDRFIQYTATNGQTVFPYDFPIFSETHLEVLQNGTVKTLTTHYTVSGVDVQAGGNVTLVSGAALNDIITIRGVTPEARVTDFNQAGDFLAATVNRELDIQIQIDQQLRRDVDKKLGFADDSAFTGLSVPDPVASTIIGWNAGATALENYAQADFIGPTGATGAAGGPLVDGDYGDVVVTSSGTVISLDSAVVTTAAKTVLDDANVAAMVNTLGGATSTGTGGLARATSPTFVTPVLGDAAATSINFGGGALSSYIPSTSWTPTIAGVSTPGTPTYVTQVGTYNRVGDLVKVTGSILISNIGGMVGRLRIGGLPVTINGSVNSDGPQVTYYQGMAAASYTFFGLFIGGDTKFDLYKASSGAVADLTHADITNNFGIRFTAWYPI
jgi:hypothetical protein